MTGGWFLRPETPDDWSAIDAVHEQAFGQPGEEAERLGIFGAPAS